MSNIDELIEQLRRKGLSRASALGYHSGLFDEAADALEKLQAENEKLRVELEQVKQKYDEAREAICTHCMDFPCSGESCYWWRGQKGG